MHHPCLTAVGLSVLTCFILLVDEKEYEFDMYTSFWYALMMLVYDVLMLVVYRL